MTLDEAVNQGIKLLRKPHWEDPRDQLELNIVRGTRGRWLYGPWATLYSPSMAQCGMPNLVEQRLMIMTDESNDWEPWYPQ